MAGQPAWSKPGVRLRGDYMYLLTMIDQDGNGWQVRANFAVVP